jgi:outer membrane protein OmpA-like peptidoglycan-associated protein/tetratricopeptide (TPR) repeat protein
MPSLTHCYPNHFNIVPPMRIQTIFPILAIIGLCLLLPSASFAQKAKLKQANKLFTAMSYQRAIISYLEILDKYDVAQAKINLAECYRLIGNKSETEYWYGQVVHLPEAKPIHKLYYGLALQTSNKCELARQWFDEYARLEPNDLRAQFLAKSCESVVVMDLMSSSAEYYEIKNLPSPINSNAGEFGATIYQNGIVFCSSRDKGGAVVNIDAQTGEGFFDNYYVETQEKSDKKSSTGYGKPVKLDGLNTPYHDGPVCFSPDGNMVFLTRTNMTGKDDGGVRRSKIYYAMKLKSGKWSEPKGIPCNSDEYSNLHPALSADGNTLYFASDMKTGWGQMDIYYIKMEDGRWGPPNNLGIEINTEGNEAYPFIHSNGTLYFSSDGRQKLGGMDVYYTKIGNDRDGVVHNMGYPVNSLADDISFVLSEDRTTGYFSSDRNGGTTGHDLFSVKRLALDIDVLVVDKKTGKPIENAIVMSECGTKKFTTDASGRFATEMPLNKCCEFAASKTDYTSESKSVCTKGKQAGQLLRVRIELESDKREEIELAGVIRGKNGKAISNAEVQLKNAKGNIVQTTNADDKGNYKFMVRQDEKYEVVCDIDKYLASAVMVDTRVNSTTKTPTKPKVDKPLEGQKTDTPKVETPVAQTETKKISVDFTVRKEEDVKKSMTFVMSNIYWSFGEAKLREEAFPSIDKLYSFLKNNPTLTVEIGSHTDSRGTNKANIKLSQQRAQAVLDYIVSKGIQRSRLTAKGYGEENLLNSCGEKVKCSEEEHQRNRRTEFKVTGTIDGQKFDSKSDVPERIQVDGCTNCSF